MDKLFETLGMAGTLCAIGMASGLIVFVVVWATKNKWKLKGKNGEVFQLGADTPFEKTNARFKQMCAEVSEIRDMFESTRHDVKVMAEALYKVQIDQQKQIFYGRDQRDVERLASGLRYVQMGGNGDVKKDVVDFARANRSIYDAITIGAPEMRLPADLLVKEGA